MMEDMSYNFYTVCDSADAYFAAHFNGKGSGYKEYLRWKFENEGKYYPSGNRIVDHYLPSKAFDGFLKGQGASPKALTNGWEKIGPDTISLVTGHYSVGLGRIEVCAVHPTDSNKLYLGSRSGGFWRSTNGGATWQNTTDTLFASGVNAIATSPTNFDSVLINVRNASNGTSHGIYRSTNGGQTWTQSPFNPTNLGQGGLGSNFAIFVIAYHPSIANLVFVGTNAGLYRSTNNLQTWTQINASADITDIKFHPTDPNIVYVYDDYYYSSTPDQILISTNQGVSFTAGPVLTGNGGARVFISTSDACPNCVYAGSSNGVWRSLNMGNSFTFLSSPNTTTLGFEVSDIDTSFMFLGYLDGFKSTNGGQSFTQSTYWSIGNNAYLNSGTYIHADVRNTAFVNGSFYVCTDGFLCKSNDNCQTWSILNKSMSVRENYNLGMSQSNNKRTICGSQDNGTSIKTENGWIEFYGADGMEGIIHPLNPDWMIGSVQYGTRRRTLDGGITQSGVTPAGQNGAWIAPLVFDPNNPMTVYHFGDSIYKSTDFGDNWTNIGSPNFAGPISYAAIAENNSNIMAMSYGATLYKTLNGGQTFTNISAGLPNASITDIAFAPHNDYIMVVTYGTYQNNNQKVYLSTNMGATWQNITSNLGNMPLRSVVIDNTPAHNIYVGAEIGVFRRPLSGGSWTLYNSNLPNMSVNELEINYGANTLQAATWGRGLWENAVFGRSSFPVITKTEITNPPTLTVPKEGVDQWVTSNIEYADSLTAVYIKWSINVPSFTNTIPMHHVTGAQWLADSILPNYPAGTKMYFKVYAVGESADTTETYKFMYTVRPFEYCNGVGTTSGGNLYLNNVAAANMTNSGTGNNNYTYYANKTLLLKRDSTYSIQLNANTGWTDNDFAAWIDYNNDSEFDATEAILFDPNSGSSSNGIFTVPTTAVYNDTLRMRVRLSYWGSTPSPCGTTLGEVEDYSVVVQPVCTPNTTHLYVTSCGPYTWSANGQTYAVGANYLALVPDSIGCDSTLILHLTLHNPMSTAVAMQACDSYTWSATNQTYTNSGNYTVAFSSQYGCDSIVTLNLSINNSTQQQTDTAVCGVFTWQANNQIYAATGNYQAVYTNQFGCDSVETLSLIVDSIDAQIAFVNGTLSTPTSGSTYQWLDCSAGTTAIVGATSNSYQPSTNGDYAVVVTNSLCADTSNCVTVSGLSITSLNQEFVTVFPNPSNGDLTIEVPQQLLGNQLLVIDALGKQVTAFTLNSITQTIQLNYLAAGVYQLVLANGQWQQKWVKY